MYVLIKINTNTEAFEEFTTWEVARILRDLAKRIKGHPHFSPGHDQALLDLDHREVGYCQVLEGQAEL